MPEPSTRPTLTIPIGGPAQALAYTPDGRLLAAVTRTGAVRLYLVTTGALVATIMDPGTGVASAARWLWARLWGNASDAAGTSVAFSPEGRLLATGGWDKTVRVWSVATRQPVRILADQGPVLSVAFSSSGKLLAAGGHDKVAKLWVMPEGRIAARLAGHGGHVTAVAFAPDGTRLATGCQDGSVRIWSAPGGALLATVPSGSPIHGLAFSPDGDLLAVASQKDTSVLDAREPRWLADLGFHKNTVECVAFSPEGDLMATGSWDKTVLVWKKPARTPWLTLATHTASVFGVTFDATGRYLASASYDGNVRVWGPLLQGQPRPLPKPPERAPGSRPCPVCFEPTAPAEARCLLCGSEIDRVAGTARRAREALDDALGDTRSRLARTARHALPIVVLAAIVAGWIWGPQAWRALLAYLGHAPPPEPTASASPAPGATGPTEGPARPPAKGTIRVPPGPDQETFRTLRDSHSAREVDRAIGDAAARESARLEAEAQYHEVGPSERARLLRLILASDRPDPSVPSRLEEAYHSGDAALLAAAIEHDADKGSPKLPQRLSTLGKTPPEKAGRLLGEALLGAQTPSDEASRAALRGAMESDPELATRFAPVALLAGDGEALSRSVEDVATGHGASRRLAERALEDFTGERLPAEALKDPEKALAAWEKWRRSASPVLDLWKQACRDPGTAGVASCQAARVELARRPQEARAALRALARDSLLRTPASTDGLAVVLPRIAGRGDAALLATFLDALPLDAKGGGPGAVAGAIAAADSGVVAAAGRVVLRGVAPVGPLAARIPDLVRPAPDAILGLARIAQELPAPEQGAALEVRGAFRDGRAVLEQALGGSTVEGEVAEDALARAGFDLAEDWLVRAVLGIEKIGRYPSPDAAARALGEVGTRAAARSLLARLGEKRGPSLAALAALGRLGGPAEGLALVRYAEQHAEDADPRVPEAALASAARIAGPDALERLAALAGQHGRPLAPLAQSALLAVDHPAGRERALRPLQDWLAGAKDAQVPTLEQIAALARVGEPADAALLHEALTKGSRDAAWEARVLRAVAVLEPGDPRGSVRSRLGRESGTRGEAALVLLRSGDLSAAPLVARALEAGGPALDAPDALALASLATGRPELAARLAHGKLEKTGPRELDAALLALALSPVPGDAAALEEVAGSPQEERRASLARVLLALGRARFELPAAPALAARLHLDPSPAVRAVAALVAAESDAPGALEDVVLALDSPAPVLARPLASPALDAVSPAVEPPTLVAALARTLEARAHERGLELDLFPSSGRGRIREAQRAVRASLSPRK